MAGRRRRRPARLFGDIVRRGLAKLALPGLLFWVIALTLTEPTAAYGLTKLEGEYQLMLDIRREDDRKYEWNYDSNHPETWLGNHFRLFSVPYPNTEVFAKFEAGWNKDHNSGRRPFYQYRESHLRYRWDRGNSGADTYLFHRQDRFWVENHLIGVVEAGELTDNGNAQGVRVDIWGLGGAKLTCIASDFSSQSWNPGEGGETARTDDAYVARLRKEFFGNHLRLGMTYNRLVELPEGEPRHLGVLAVDARYSIGMTDIFLEYADTYSHQNPDHEESGLRLKDFNLHRLYRWLPRDGALKGEIRSLTLGTPRLGYYNIVPTFWYFGPNFANRLGEASRDQQGVWINTWYLLPQRAITLTLNYTSSENLVYQSRHSTEVYAEVYTEYVNGFTSKVFYSDRKDRNRWDPREVLIEVNRDLFLEIQVESQLAWMRVQVKLKDFNSSRRKDLASLESTLNLTDKLKLYGRYAFGNDPARLRKGLFAQLQYRPQGNMEVFLEYGPSWIGDSPNPVEDGDLAGSEDNRDLLKFIIKGTF
ncbi:MAG: hypothetical protein KAY32_16200 [Candidatus Eisenbacteria sp.]|nr:hypothetical protein [Candidatus Eisenbacteria bacterium]